MTIVKKIHKFMRINCSLLLCYISVTVFLFMMISNYLSTKELNKISRGYLTIDSQEFKLDGNINADEFEKIINETLPKNGAVFRKDFSQEEIIGIYKKDGFKTPPLMEGRFLTDEESFSSKKVAVVGQGLKHGIKTESGKKWIEINGSNYEVIGIIGADYNTRLDSMMYIPLTLVNEIYGINSAIIVDGIKNPEVFVDKVKTDGNIEIKKVEDRNATITTIDPLGKESSEIIVNSGDLKQNSLISYIYFIVFISALLCILSMSIYWYEKRKKEIIVCNILGFYINEIFIRVFNKYITVVLIGGAIGITISVLILNLI